MAPVSDRLRRRVVRDFEAGTADEVLVVLESLPVDILGGQDVERVLAAVVLDARGEWPRFEKAVQRLRWDWRDALVAGELAQPDWPSRLEAALD
ncbi:MAG TPA: hypothetical protein VFL59_09580 [Candidatus Nanopelagicales bacterium]|nr:hypothetical protein [Candidatus Nanopelagicales bacterium]